MIRLRLFSLLLLMLWWQGSQGASLLEPVDEPIEVWSAIPLVFASDIEEYKLLRDIFRGLHKEELEPAKVKALLKQVDKMKGRATERIWRSYNTDLIGHYDRLVEERRIDDPRLRFSYEGVRPASVPEELDLQSPALERLATKAGVAGAFAYVTYTRMSQKQVRSTLTLVRLRDGVSKSFTVTDEAHRVAERHAQLLFDYLHRAPFPYYRNPLAEREWVLPAPRNRDRQVSRLEAELACRSQGGALPTVDELILGEQAGPYHNGINLVLGELYHASAGMRYLAGETRDPRGKLRHDRNDRHRARYYCIRPLPSTAAEEPVTATAAPTTETKTTESQPAASQ